MEDAQRAALEALPRVDELLSRPSLQQTLSPHSRQLQLQAVRDAVAQTRERIKDGDLQPFDEADVSRAIARLSQPNLRRVVNATGVVLHTNLGRAPLPERAVRRLTEIAAGYCNLELDLDDGERGSRYQPVIALLTALTGAEDAMVVNNCAAAVLLALSALGQGREAIVSRGELVEIGGAFRVPDIMRQAGVALREVGTTNRTRLADYAESISDDTALLVKVHRSNFALVGFTEEATVRELAALATERGVPLVVDLGSGALTPVHVEGAGAEPTVAQTVKAGADVVLFSGDKLLGGPQAGIVVGRRATLEAMRRHPLNRALRIDKLCIAALEATLELYRDGREDEIPARALLDQSAETLRARAEALQAALLGQGVRSEVVATVGQVGGGSLPLGQPRSFACAVPGGQGLHDALRAQQPAVVARLSDGQLLLDVRCLTDEEVLPTSRAVAAAQAKDARPPC